jgi:hypothetical protein
MNSLKLLKKSRRHQGAGRPYNDMGFYPRGPSSGQLDLRKFSVTGAFALYNCYLMTCFFLVQHFIFWQKKLT